MGPFFALINLASLVVFVIGLINPKKVLLGENRTRRKSSEIYLSAFVISFIAMGITTPRKPDEVFQPPPIAEAKPTPTPEATPAPAPTPVEATPTPTPEVVAFDPSVCKTGDYLPVNGASIALYTTCQYLNIGSLKPESVSVVTGANDKNNADVQELRAESGFEGVTWRDYTLDPESKRDVCVEYKDESVSCYAFSDPNETAGVLVQPQETANIPTGATCENFATQADAQAALPANPQLDRDGDGTACDSLPLGTGGSHVTSGGGYNSYHHTGRRRRRR